MLNLEKCHGPVFQDDTAIFEIMCRSTLPSSFMDYCGASMVVLSLTYGCLIPFSLIPKERSMMNQNGWLLCGISATGEIFKFCGILLLIALHLITVAKPCFTFSNVYFLIVVTALLFLLRRGGISWVMLWCVVLSSLMWSIQNILCRNSLQGVYLQGEVECGQ